MVKKHSEVIKPEILDETIQITLYELCDMCGVHAELVIDMVEHGLLEPLGSSPNEWCFTAVAVQRSRKALHLQQDLGINWAGAALALDLLDEVEQLRRQLHLLEQQLK